MYYRILNKKTNEIYFRMIFYFGTPLEGMKSRIKGKDYVITHVKNTLTEIEGMECIISTGKMKID